MKIGLVDSILGPGQTIAGMIGQQPPPEITGLVPCIDPSSPDGTFTIQESLSIESTASQEPSPTQP